MNKNYELTNNDLLACYVLEEEWADMRSDFDNSLECGPIELDELIKNNKKVCFV